MSPHLLHEAAKELARLQELEKRLTLAPSIKSSYAEWERKLATYYQTYQRAETVKSASDAQLRLMCGELTAQELRSVRAVVNYILP